MPLPPSATSRPKIFRFMPTPPDPLDPLLDRWRDAAPPPMDSVGPEVWRRIAAVETGPNPNFVARLLSELARPAFAVTFAAACVLLGLFLAEVRVSRLQRERNAQMAKSYLQLIDPLLGNTSNRDASAA